MPRILAIDYGLRRTGLAWTDSLQIIATGIGSFDTPLVLPKLREIVAKEAVEAIVIGWPTHADGSDTDSTAAVRAYEHTLRTAFPAIAVHRWDERHTSSRALRAMIDGGLGQKKRRDKHLVNEISAVIILQEFLEAKG